MKKCFCDLCKKEIAPADIHTSFEIRIGEKKLDVDLHSECYYQFLDKLREDIEKNK